MVLVSEVFPGYNPLPKLVETLRILEATDQITDKEIVCEIISNAFEEAGAIIEVPEELVYIINLLVESNVLQFVGSSNDPYLITNQKIEV